MACNRSAMLPVSKSARSSCVPNTQSATIMTMRPTTRSTVATWSRRASFKSSRLASGQSRVSSSAGHATESQTAVVHAPPPGPTCGPTRTFQKTSAPATITMTPSSAISRRSRPRNCGRGSRQMPPKTSGQAARKKTSATEGNGFALRNTCSTSHTARPSVHDATPAPSSSHGRASFRAARRRHPARPSPATANKPDAKLMTLLRAVFGAPFSKPKAQRSPRQK